MALKKKQLKEKSIEELKKMLSELKLTISREKSQIKLGAAASNPMKVRNSRKTIARILTELKKKEENKTG